MTFTEQFCYAWPWMGLGMACIMIILLFRTDLLRSSINIPRWRDPIWIAWCAMPAYLLHQFEEYACHITNGQYDIITGVLNNKAMPFDLTNLTMAHFPYVNIALAWIAVPITVCVGKKFHKPIVAMAPIGFIIANGMLHFMGTITGKMPIVDNPGFFTGTFVFLPLGFLMILACVRGGFTNGKGLAVAIVSGVIGHLILAGAYGMAPMGTAAVLFFDTLTVFAPMLLALLGCKLLKTESKDLRQ